MTNTLINNSELQKNVGRFAREIDNGAFTVINRGKPKMVILPYFEDSNDLVEDYLESYLISKNRKKLKKELQDSLDSGISDFKI